MKLTIGANRLFVIATVLRYEPGSLTWSVTRTLTPALVAERKTAAQARAALAVKAAAQARVHQAQANVKASASTMSYARLLKDSSPFMGKHVSFRGQVRQIQRHANTGGFMLLSVTHLGSGLWTDNVWVDYDTAPTATTNDILTVYGTVTGTTSYPSPAGGRTYVPEIHARLINRSG
jgi:hypothetical protein